MLAKLYRVYIHFFKFLATVNIGVSFFAVALVLGREGQSDLVGAYVLAVVAKLLGFGISVVIEKWFFAGHREYFFKNMGLGYRHIFGVIFSVDIILLIIIYWGWEAIGSYL